MTALEVFFSYSHADETLRDSLQKHLALLQREGLIRPWHDRRIGAGEVFEKAIDSRLESAHIILLLISPDFLASDYCYDIEMKRALERHSTGEASVVPIILRPSDWKSSPFGHLLALPTDAKPVTTWNNLDEGFLDVASGLRRLVEARQRSQVRATEATPGLSKPVSRGVMSNNDLEDGAGKQAVSSRAVWVPPPIESLRKASSAFFKQYHSAKSQELAQTYLQYKYRLPAPEAWTYSYAGPLGITVQYGLGASWCHVILRIYSSLLLQDQAGTDICAELCADFAMLISVVYHNRACESLRFYQKMRELMDSETYLSLLGLAQGLGNQPALQAVQARLSEKLDSLRDTAEKEVEEYSTQRKGGIFT